MKRLLFMLSLLILLALTLAACTGGSDLECTDELGCVEIGPDDPIKIASALVITGANAQLGLDSQHGVEIAIDFKGEVLGHEVTLQAEDDGCNAEGGQTAAEKIVSDPQIVGVIGTSCSGAGVPAARIVTEAGYVMISPSNTAPVLTDEATHEAGYLRTAHNDKVQGAAMAAFAYNELGVRSAAAIHDGDPYTEGLASVFRDSFIELGGEIVAFEAIDANADDATPALTTISSAGPPEFIYYPVFVNLGANITKQARSVAGLENVILAAADGVQSPDFLEAAAEAAEDMYVSGPDLAFANETYEDILAAYQEMFGSAPVSVFHAHAFDATTLLLLAIEEVAQQGDDGTLLIGRKALRDALFATENYAGVTGTLTCTPTGDCADPKIAVSQVQDGAFVSIFQFEE